MKTNPRSRRGAMRGLTMVELLVAIAIGLLIMTAMAVLFANNSRSRTETERGSQKIENGRFALDVISTELQHAGFYSVFDPRTLTAPTLKPNACATALADLKTAMPVFIQGYDNVSASVLDCISDVKPGTDVFVVRRAASCVAGTTGCTARSSGAPGFQASSCNNVSELASAVVANHYKLDTAADTAFTLTERDCATRAGIYRYLVRIYYVANNDVSGDGIPTLKRAELVVSSGNLAFTSTSLVQGVDQLQIEYGIDTTNDGSADVYSASPDIYQSCSDSTTPTCVGYWTSVVAAKVFVLSRNIDSSAGHSDAKTYVMGKQATVSGQGDDKTVGPFNDAYKRSVFQEVVKLNNPASRRYVPS
jgi:type IV pilus assembly protein PilW